VLGNILGTTVAYLYARMYISRIQAYDNGTAKTLT
jgi:hypothetical protein